jgi:hypothetical protein
MVIALFGGIMCCISGDCNDFELMGKKEGSSTEYRIRATSVPYL